MKRRKDSAFGLHFDFHASPAPGKVVGKTLKEEDIRLLCETLKPDEWKRFWCLEPFMRVAHPLAPGETREHIVRINVEKEKEDRWFERVISSLL